MKRWTWLSVVLLVASVFLSDNALAEEITLRYDQKDGLLRIVLQADSDRYVQRAKVRSTYSLVKIEFPGDFILKGPPDTGGMFEYSKKVASLYLNIRDMKWLRILRLGSPPRLIIDAYLFGETQVKEPAEEPAPEKPLQKETVPSAPQIQKRLKKIVLDPGHGGTDIGVFSPVFAEKKVVFRVAKALRRALKDKRVYLTRTEDRKRPLMKRIMYARKKSPDLFISIHMTTTNSINVYTVSTRFLKDRDPLLLSASQMKYLSDSKRVANFIGESLKEELNTEVNYREAPLPVLAYMNSPAILIELPSGDFFEYSGKNIRRIVEAIKKGIQLYEGS